MQTIERRGSNGVAAYAVEKADIALAHSRLKPCL